MQGTHDMISTPNVSPNWHTWACSQANRELYIDDGNCSENVSFKMNSRFFNLCRVYFNLMKMASVDKFPWSWFLEDALKFRERKSDSSSLVYFLHKTCNWAFSRRSRARTVKKCTKNVMHEQSCCFANLNLLLFWRPFCRRRRRC